MKYQLFVYYVFLVSYVRGNPNTLCDPEKKIGSAKQCKTAAVTLGLRIVDDLYNDNESEFPGGCFATFGCLGSTDEYCAYFNTKSGKADKFSSPICLKGKSILLMATQIFIPS